MRILLVQQDTCLYGASQSLIALISRLEALGHKCLVLLPQDGPLAERLDTTGVKQLRLHWHSWVSQEGLNPFRCFLSGFVRMCRNRRAIVTASSSLRGFMPDLVHTLSSKTPFGAMLAHSLQVPHVWHFREFLGGTYSAGISFSLGVHASKHYIQKRSAGAVMISNTLAQYYKLRGIPVYVIYNGVMSNDEMQAAVKRMPDFPITLALIGRIEPRKDPFTALDAVRRVSARGFKVQLTVAGGGEEQFLTEVKAFVDRYRLRQIVNFIGFSKDITRIYQQSHALIMPSLCDAFGRVTAEAMACGRPVIGARAGATQEIISNGHNGLLFEPANGESLSLIIEQLINAPEMLAELGANAARTAQEHFTIEKHVNSILKVYESVTN